MTDKTADTVADELLTRLERLRVTENERALLRAVLALAFSEGERLARELDDRRHLTAGIIEEKDRLRAALKRITECTEERDGGEGIQVISGSSREFWYAVIAAKELTHGRPAAKTSGVSSHGLGPISATDVAYLRGETDAKLLTGVAFLHRWMRTVNPLLGGVTPLDMIKAGRGEKLAAFIEEASEMNEATGEQP